MAHQVSRRELFLTNLAGAGIGAALPAFVHGAQSDHSPAPWFRRCVRWGQTNISERDPARYDVEWWRQHCRRTGTQGLVINAGGIVAYYPSKFPLHHRAEFLGDRDLYGDLTRAAHTDGMAVLARMDSNRAYEDFYQAHPDWFAVDFSGTPYRAGDHYITCIDSPYYQTYLPDLLREIIAWEKPEGFTDNSWSGLDRNQICYCRYSRESFRNKTGHELPAKKDWNDPAYRAWIEWSYGRRTEIWDLNNRVTKDAGGKDCLWLGMIGGDFISQGQRFRDIKTICERTEMIMLDDQSRDDGIGFQENAEMGKRLHGLLGWEKIIPESMATYQRSPVFRKSAATKAESRMWMYSGFAGGIQPWWHHVGAYQWDRRQFTTAIPVYEWYAQNESYLLNRSPVASVGVVYSQQNADFYGRDAAMEKVGRPYYGIIQALVRSRVPYLPIHVDHIGRGANGASDQKVSTLILPNLAAMTDAQVEAVRQFAAAGGCLLITGETAFCNQWGDPRPAPALADLCGVRFTGKRFGSTGEADSWSGTDHSYLRLHPDLGNDAYGPKSGDEPATSVPRHEVLHGFEETDILPFGGLLQEITADAGTVSPITFVPSFPAYPPETSWMRTPRTTSPALVLRELPSGGRIAYLAADLDRRFSRDNLPDHGHLLKNLVRWAARNRIPLHVEGTGLLDCHLYRQENRLILHLVNLTSAGSWRSPVDDLIAVGPFKISLQLSHSIRVRRAKLLVAKRDLKVSVSSGWATVAVPSILDHEVVVVE